MAERTQTTASDRAINNTANLAATAFSKATAGVKGFAGGLLDTNPQLSTLTSGLGKLNDVVKYLEGGLGALQAFSRYGVDFDMSIGLMNRSAAGARLGLDELHSIVSSNTDAFLMMGNGITGVGDGVKTFLNLQKQFFFDVGDKASEASLQLMRLGLTTKDINETFLTYDAIEGFRRKGERLTTAQRNLAAAEFAKSLDKLSKLTGKQTDQINKEIRQKMRQGDVAAFGATLEKEARTDFLKATTFMTTALGPDLGQLFEDLVIRGFPDKEVAALLSTMPKTADAFKEYGKVVRTGTKEQRDAALATAAQIASQEAYTKQNIGFAQLGNRVGSEVMAMQSRVAGATATGFAEAAREVTAEMQAAGEDISKAGPAFFARVQKRQEELMKSPTADAGGDTPNDIKNRERLATEALLKLQGTASEIAQAAQKQIDGLYRTLGESANKFADYLKTELNPTVLIGDIMSTVNSALGITGSGMSTAVQRSEAAVQNAIRANNPELAAEINRLVTQVISANESDRTKLIEALGEKIKEAMSLTWEAQSVVINSNGEVVVNGVPTGRTVEPRHIPPGQRGAGTTSAIGTQGAVGRLFKDFGKETKVALHGLQSVQTPEQTTEIMKNSALGALRAVDDIFNAGNFSSSISKNIIPTIESIAANNVQTLNGMLNTMQNTSKQMVSNASPKGMDIGELTSSFKTAMGEIRKPIEDVAKSLKGPMEQLAQTAGQQLEIQQKHLKATKGLTNDVLRGIA